VYQPILISPGDLRNVVLISEKFLMDLYCSQVKYSIYWNYNLAKNSPTISLKCQACVVSFSSHT
jgi:hypothetical protein